MTRAVYVFIFDYQIWRHFDLSISMENNQTYIQNLPTLTTFFVRWQHNKRLKLSYNYIENDCSENYRYFFISKVGNTIEDRVVYNCLLKIQRVRLSSSDAV